MKRFFSLVMVLAVMAALPSLGFQYWGDDYEKYAIGENMLDNGYTTFSTYAGNPVVVEAGGQKALQLQAKDGGSTDYNMVLTPVIGGGWDTLASSGLLPETFDLVIRGSIIPASGVDLLALYGQSTNRFFFFNFNKEGKLATDPGSKEFTVSTSEYNEVAATLHYSAGVYTLTKVVVNGDSWTGEAACSSGDAPRFLRLSTQLSSLAEGNKGAIFGSVAVDMANANGRNLYVEGFEDKEVGTEMGSQPGYGFFNNYTGYSTVIDNWPGLTGKAMDLKQKDGGSSDYVMLLTPAFELTPDNPGSQLTEFKFRFACGSDTDLLALYDKSMNRFFYLKATASTGVMDSNPSGILFSNIFTDAQTMNEVTFRWDSVNCKIISATCNGQTNEVNIVPSGSYDAPARLRLSTQLTSLASENGAAYDLISVTAVNRSDDPELYCADEALIPLNSTSAKFPIYNAGPPTGTINYSITSDGSWLSVTPDSGSFNESQELVLSAKAGTEEGFYRCNMTVDAGAAGSRVVSVVYQNGVIFFEDFEDFTQGNIVGQRNWTVNVGSVWVTNSAYGSQGKCAFAAECGGSYGAGFFLPKPWYEGLIVTYQFDVYFPADSGAGELYFLGENDATEKVEGYFQPGGEGLVLKNINGKNIKDFPAVPFDQWFTLVFTIDMQTQKLLDFTAAGVTTNFVNFPLLNTSVTAFDSFGFACWSGSQSSNVAVDNIKLATAKRGDEPLPVVAPSTFMGTNSTCVVKVVNAGGGTFNFTASVLDLDDAITLNPASGTVTDYKDLRLTLDRKSLEDGYYRSRVLVDCGEYGSFTNVVSFSAGDVYYETDFQAPFFALGDFNNQDGWETDIADNVADIIETNGTQTLLVNYAGGYGGYGHVVQVPKNSQMKVEFDFLVPENVFMEKEDDVVMFLKQHDRYNPILQMTINKEIVDGVNCVYGVCDDGYNVMPRVECNGEFLHCTYVLDLKEGKVLEFTIGDEPFYPDEAYTEKSDVSCDNVYICVSNGMNVQFKNYKVSVVPEPAILGLLALVALYLRRK